MCLFLPALPIGRQMLVDCRKIARVDQSTLADLMVRTFHQGQVALVSANSWNVAQDQQSTEIPTTQAATQHEADKRPA